MSNNCANWYSDVERMERINKERTGNKQKYELSIYNEDGLRRCPFCGYDSPTITICKGKDGWRDRYTVICRYDEGGCGAESGMYHSEVEAVEAWNKRV